MKISELSSKLSVSEMTIHRDLKPLIDEGFVMKTFGGVTLANVPTEDHVCVYCHRSINEKLAFRLILTEDQTEIACCAHCGLLRYKQISNKVNQMICQDFLLGTTINARLATFVMHTSLNLSCCQPQVLPFEYLEHAKRFIKGFQGVTYSFDEAVQAVYNEMISPKD